MYDYNELKNLLTNLFRKLYFPMGDSNDAIKQIWMNEPKRSLITTVTEKGYVTVSSDGDIFITDSIEKVEQTYLLYFTGKGSLEELRQKLSA